MIVCGKEVYDEVFNLDEMCVVIVKCNVDVEYVLDEEENAFDYVIDLSELYCWCA